MKKSLQKKAPLEQLFSETFFQFPKMDNFEMSKIEISKNFWEKNCSKGAFFWRLFLETFFGDFFSKYKYNTYILYLLYNQIFLYPCSYVFINRDHEILQRQ